MVAVGLMAMIIAFSSIIFRFGIDAHRISSANAEIMQKARAITEQLNSDLRGLRKDAPILIWFEQDNTADEPNRYDQIMFFADGEFTSYRQYRKSLNRYVELDDATPYDSQDYHVVGNLARIYYSLARSFTDDRLTTTQEPIAIKRQQDRILARRVHILTADPCVALWPNANNIDSTFGNLYPSSGVYLYNDVYEHDSVPLAKYKSADSFDNAAIVHTCFDDRALVDRREVRTFHNLMCEAVGSLAVQWAYWDRKSRGDGGNDYELRWFPGDDPDGDGQKNDSQMTLNGVGPNRKFGVHFMMPAGTDIGDWHYVDELEYYIDDNFTRGFYPAALKFTFKVYDSKGIIKGGRTFTHIVYLED